MYTMNKSKRVQSKKKSPMKRSIKKRSSSVGSKRKNIMNGGSTFPASFNNNTVTASPQSYLPYNNFANDPNYGVVAARNTGPFLTGVSTGGKKRKSSRRKYNGGGLTSYLSNNLNTVTNGVGIMPAPALNESSGVARLMSGFSNTTSMYDPNPLKMAPLA